MFNSVFSVIDSTNDYVARGINQERLHAILKYAGSSILDVGCGSGAYVIALNGRYEIRGVDYQKFPTWSEALHLFSLSDAATLTQENESVETVTCFETLEHLQNPEKALKEFFRVCRKNVILTVPNCELTPAMLESKLIYNTWVDRTHVQFFNMSSFSSLVEENGFKVVKKYYINKIPLSPFLEEAFDFSGISGKVIKRLLLRRKAKDYYITCLVIADKTR